MGTFLLYGATGFTGRLAAARAVELGMRPVLAGRSAWPLSGIARSLGLEHRVFGLNDPTAIDAALAGVTLVLNAAGPFSQTAKPLVEACLRARKHYADITGEVDVMEAIYAKHDEAVTASVMLLPGAGFDVVPSDCLARFLKERLPDAGSLVLAFRADTRLSHGTAETMIERMNRPGMVRRRGDLVPVPLGSLLRTTPFPALAIPWGDLASAFRSTGIPDIECYTAAGAAESFGLKLSRIRPLAPLLRSVIRAMATGPDEALRKTGRSLVWGEVASPDGKRFAARLDAPEPYALTVEAMLAVAKKVLANDLRPGAQTPATAYGSGFVMELGAVTRTELTPD